MKIIVQIRSKPRYRVVAGVSGAAVLAVVCAAAVAPELVIAPLAGGGTSPSPAGAAKGATGDGARGADGGGAGGEEEVAGAAGPPPPAGAVQVIPHRIPARTAAEAMLGHAERLERAERLRATAARRWRVPELPPLAPPPPPEKVELKTEPGHIAGAGLPPVITRVPTDDKVVFLTIDDGAEKDPDLLRMMRELDIPYSSFVTDYVARDDYGYFRAMRRDGNHVHNHTVTHKELPRLSRAGQREEICDQQDNLEREIGERPALFRPPYGAYDESTLRAAAECGVQAVPLWAEEAFADRMEWGRADRRFHPGDIILTHFRGEDAWAGSMPDMIRLVLKTVAEQGFAIARLEDYI
ncbi:polysaccharide deacetylase family protein [Streptomyces aidingensis]|nr:polysaccharide deacetylase family protein [Streptomyces aidingensis]